MLALPRRAAEGGAGPRIGIERGGQRGDEGRRIGVVVVEHADVGAAALRHRRRKTSARRPRLVGAVITHARITGGHGQRLEIAGVVVDHQLESRCVCASTLAIASASQRRRNARMAIETPASPLPDGEHGGAPGQVGVRLGQRRRRSPPATPPGGRGPAPPRGQIAVVGNARAMSAAVAPTRGVLGVDQVARNGQCVVEGARRCRRSRSAGRRRGRPAPPRRGARRPGPASASQAERQRQVIQADVDLVDAGTAASSATASSPRRVSTSSTTRARPATMATNRAASAAVATIGNMTTRGAQPEDGVDLATGSRRTADRRGRTARPGSSAAPTRARSSARVRRDPRAAPALTLGLAEALEIDADPIDAGGIGPRRQRRVARPEGQDERVRR